MSKSLRFFKQIAHSLFCLRKTSNSLATIWLKFYFFVCFFGKFIKKTSDLFIPSFLMSDVRESLRSLTKNEQCEQITQVAHQTWASVSNLLRSLTRNERTWANCSGSSPKMSESLIFLSELLIRNFFAKNGRSTHKWNERIPNPGTARRWASWLLSVIYLRQNLKTIITGLTS